MAAGGRAGLENIWGKPFSTGPPFFFPLAIVEVGDRLTKVLGGSGDPCHIWNAARIGMTVEIRGDVTRTERGCCQLQKPMLWPPTYVVLLAHLPR